MALTGIAIALFMVGVETVGRSLLPSSGPELCIVGGALLFWLAVRHCRRVAHPAMEFSLLDIPSFHASNVVGGLFRIGAGAMPFLVPLTLQLSFGMSASSSGMLSLASALGSFCMKPLARGALSLMPARTVLLLSSVAFAAVLLLCAAMNARWPAYAVFAVLLAAGLARSLSFATMGALSFADVPAGKLSAATSFQGTAQQLSRAVGVTLAALAMQLSMYLAARKDPSVGDFAAAFVVVAIAVLSAVPAFLAMSPTLGEGLVQQRIKKIT